MDRIPVSFEYKGKPFTGYFSKVSGAGSTSVWHLTSDEKYYFGQLHLINGSWVFQSQTGEFKELADYFGDIVTAWYE